MELIGAMYQNMKRSTHRNYFMQSMLSGFNFPPGEVHRLAANDAGDYENKETICNAAIADGFPFFELLRDSWMNKINVACQWTWCCGLRAMRDMLAPGKSCLYLLDDHFIRRTFYDFNQLVAPLDDLLMLQIFQWDVRKEGDGKFKNPEFYAPKNFEVCESNPHVYHGFNYAGDSIAIFSGDGAARSLDWIAEFPYEFLETHVLRRSQLTLPGCYSIVHDHEWIGWIDVSIVGSYRENIAPANRIHLE